MLTRLLALGNVLVVNSAVRRGAYWHMLETCLHSSLYSSHIESVLVGVSERLGLASLSVLFEAYASQLAYSLRQAKSDFLSFPPHLLGYRDRTQCAKATFRAFTPTNILSDGVKLFVEHCKILQKDLRDGLAECFGEIVGVHIVFWINEDNLEQLLTERLAFTEGLAPPFEDVLDGIATTIMKSLGDQDFSANGSISKTLQQEYPRMQPTYLALVRYRHFDPLQSHLPNLPAFSTSALLRSLDWLSSRWGGFTTHTTYHVLHNLVEDLHQTPLINEQIRLVNAISLWITYRQKDFEEPTIADTLIHGATLLLAQPDLVQSAQSMLEWAFGHYPQKPLEAWKHTRLPNLLVRIRSIAHDYCSKAIDSLTAELGEELVTWFDAQMSALARRAVHRGWIHRVLSTWPRQPSSELAKVYDDISTHDIFSTLEDHRITSNKFRLVRRIQERALGTPHDEKEFSKSIFWRLKECIPPLDRLQEEDTRAFAAVLSLNHGQIGSLTTEQHSLLSPKTRHRRNVNHIQKDMQKRKKTIASDPADSARGAREAARDAITVVLLSMLDNDDASHVFSAFSTLRLIMAAPVPDHSIIVIPSEYRKDVEFLKTYKRVPVRHVAEDIHVALRSDLYLSSSYCFSEWISLISILFAGALGTADPFFDQLSSILAFDIAFSEQILPILVHAILMMESAQNSKNQPLRESLSIYFTTILSSPRIDSRCVCSVVDIVLYLRNFASDEVDALSHDKWLSVDFSLLARSAIVCGAYTTALLFVELAAEHNCQHDDTSTEDVLYEIYAHIDEPDGFYGIKTRDLQQFLIKRFHHEKQWDKAFRFHGAALEAGSTLDRERIGLLDSFHAFGFDHLAIDTLRNFREASSNQPSSSVDYKLGWRTETWDLPDRAIDATNASLYRSLRAIYRERNARTTDITLRSALFDEMQRLKSLGTENLAEIRIVARDIMCLNELLHWRRDETQELLQTQTMTLDKWRDFVEIDDGYE